MQFKHRDMKIKDYLDFLPMYSGALAMAAAFVAGAGLEIGSNFLCSVALGIAGVAVGNVLISATRLLSGTYRYAREM